MNLDDALSEFGRQLGLTGFALNDAGLARLVFDGRLPVDFERVRDGRALHLASRVAAFAPQTQDEAFYRGLLQANWLGLRTGGAHFSVSEPDEEVLLERTLDMDALDYLGFVREVERFVDHLEHWLGTLSEPAPAALGLSAEAVRHA